MNNLVNVVMNGSFSKVAALAEADMKKNYTKETAYKYYQVYKDATLSYILQNVYSLLREAFYGTDFIIHLIKTATHVYSWSYLLDTCSELIEEAKKNNAPENQINKYKELKELIKAMDNKMHYTSKLFNIAGYRNNLYSELFFDYLYQAERTDDKELFAEAIDSLKDINDPIVFFIISALLLSKYPKYVETIVFEKSQEFLHPYRKDMSKTELKNYCESVIALNFLAKDEYVTAALNQCSINLKNLWSSYMYRTLKDIDDARIKVFELSEISIKDINYGFVNKLEEYLTESTDDINRDRVELEKYSNLIFKEAIMNAAVLESALNENEKAIEFYESQTEEVYDELYYLEWGANGEPSKIVASHATTDKDNPGEKPEKKEEDKKEKDSDDEDEQKEVDAENKSAREDILKKVDECVEGLETKCHYVKKEREDFIAGKDNSICLGSFGKDKYKPVLSALRKLFSTNEDFKVKDDNYFTIFVYVKTESDYYVESFTDEFDFSISEYSMIYEATEVPDKPKEDLATKIQNKALDHDVKRKEKQAIHQEARVKLKNAGKAVMSGPSGWFNSAKKFTDDIDRMDDDRRKSFFMKPGYRHRIFKNMKLSLLYGTATKANIFLLPVTMLIRHFSKDKDRRIRNELIRELDVEIKVCEEKISDANSNGDQSEKYKLMRIKEKLVAEQQRVQINSKFI